MLREKKRSVLVVNRRFAFQATLEALGFDVVFCRTIEEAAQARGPFGLVIVGSVEWDKLYLGKVNEAEFRTPVAALTQRLARQYHNVPFILLVSNAEEWRECTSTDWGGLRFIVFSQDRVEVCDIVNAYRYMAG